MAGAYWISVGKSSSCASQQAPTLMYIRLEEKNQKNGKIEKIVSTFIPGQTHYLNYFY